MQQLNLIGELIFVLLRNMGVVVTFAYLLSRTQLFKRFFDSTLTRKEKIFLTFFFGVLSLCGTYLGIHIMHAYANIRAIGAVVGGLLGGPVVGLLAGAIGGLHRYTLGGFTALACAVGTMSSGLIGGLFHNQFKNQKLKSKQAFKIGVVALVVEMLIVGLVSRPLGEAVNLIKVISLPMILANAAGIAIFINILNSVRREVENIKAKQAKKVLNIANRTLNFFGENISHDKAVRKAAEEIFNLTDVSAVAITDQEQVVAFVGAGNDHHESGAPIQTKITKQAIEQKKIMTVTNKQAIGCPVNSCPLKAVVVAPLKCGDEIMGGLKLYRTTGKLSKLDVFLADGISSLLSTQIRLSQLAEEAKLKKEAELNALQAQIHPHFLFNSLNTIASFVRTDAQKAKQLLLNLSEFFRSTLRQKRGLISLEQELSCIDDYFAIEKARFGDKINLVIDVPEKLLAARVPNFSVQPLVENAVQHGLLPQKGADCVQVRAAEKQNDLIVEVIDNGIGIAEEKLEKILLPGYGENSGFGLSNVAKRIENNFGLEYGVTITSKEKTRVRIRMPLIFSQKEEANYAAAGNNS